MQKFKGQRQSVRKIERKQTEGQTEVIALCTFLANVVGNKSVITLGPDAVVSFSALRAVLLLYAIFHPMIVKDVC